MSLTVQYNQLDFVRNEIHQGLRIDGAGSSSWVSWDALRSLEDVSTYLEIGTWSLLLITAVQVIYKERLIVWGLMIFGSYTLISETRQEIMYQPLLQLIM